MFDMSQYGVNTGSQAMSGLASVASMIPVLGPFLGMGMNMIGTAMQNRQQEQFYNKYMSPAARMAQMRAAGINPNAAAQGISGAAAPQMNAAAPTSAFSSLGEALGQSVNTGLTAGNIAAQTKNLEVQTEGQDLMNKMTEVELGMKPSLLSAELDDLRADAEQKRQAVEQSKAEVKKIDQEVDNLKTQKEYLLTQIGLAEYDKRLKDAETRAANAKAALDNAERELTEVNKEIQEKERDNYLTPEERIEKQAHETEVAKVEENPQGRIAKELENEMNRKLEWIDALIKDKESVFGPNHNEVRKLHSMRERIIRQYARRIRRVYKGASAGFNVAGSGISAGG